MGRPKYPLSSNASAIDGEAVTPNDDADIPGVGGTLKRGATRAIMVGVSGDLAVVMASGRTVTWPALAAGVFHPISCTRVLATGTEAENICAAW